MSNLQGGFWTFLFFTLIGPFFAAVGTILVLPVLIHMQLGPFAGDNWGVLNVNSDPTIGQVVSFSAITAIRGYIWSAIPAAISGLIFAIVLARGWPSGWGVAGSIGVFGFMVAAILMPIEHGGLLAYIAVGAGFVAIACRAVMVKAGILRPDGAA
jgi:hypothetical protein